MGLTWGGGAKGVGLTWGPEGRLAVVCGLSSVVSFLSVGVWDEWTCSYSS